jgi:plastocyanin
MNRRAFLAATGSLSAAGLAGCFGVGGEPAGEYDVGMSSDAFLPEAYPQEGAIEVGETVVWKNTGSRTHTVTAYEGALPEGAAYFAAGGFDSEEAAREAWSSMGGERGAVESGTTYEHTFEVPGEYRYFCIPHEKTGMVGTITVRG